MFPRLLEQIALGLESRAIPYMVIGGQAVLLYGEPRLTRDIDITLGAGPERLGEILGLVETWGWRVLVETPPEFLQKTMVLPALEPDSGIRVDFIFSFSPYERQAIEHARAVPIGKAQVRFASAEDLIVTKIIAGRPRDLEDVRGILLKNPHLDTSYIRKWLGDFDASLGESFTQKFDEVVRQAE